MPDFQVTGGVGSFSFDIPSLADTDGLFAVDSDPDVWRHSPGMQDVTPDDSREAIERSLRRWREHGLDHWILHDGSGEVVGTAGVRRMRLYWNLYARISPAVQGHGVASAALRAAIAAAGEVESGLPVVGRLRATNDASRRLMERLGVPYRLRYPADDGGADWLVHADRPLSDQLREWFSA